MQLKDTLKLASVILKHKTINSLKGNMSCQLDFKCSSKANKGLK